MLYNKTEAAKQLRVSTKTVDRAIADGRLKACVVGASTRISQDDLDRFAGSRVVVPKPVSAEKFIPRYVLQTLAREMQGIRHGTVSLTIHLRDHKPRFVIGREQSFLPEDAVRGS